MLTAVAMATPLRPIERPNKIPRPMVPRARPVAKARIYLFHEVRDIGIAWKTAERAQCDAGCFDKCHRFPGEIGRVQLIKSHHTASHYSREQVFESCLRRLVEVKIQIEQTDQKMGILLQILGYGFAAIALNEFDLGDVAEGAISIVNGSEVV